MFLDLQAGADLGLAACEFGKGFPLFAAFGSVCDDVRTPRWLGFEVGPATSSVALLSADELAQHNLRAGFGTTTFWSSTMLDFAPLEADSLRRVLGDPILVQELEIASGTDSLAKADNS